MKPIVHLRPRDTAGQLPPHDLDAERALIACAFHAPDVLEAAVPKVAPGDFYSEQHAQIWRELLSLRAEGAPTDDAPTLIRRLRESATTDTVTYATRIVVDDTRVTGTIAHASRYLDAVASAARRRRKIVAAQRAEAILRDTTDADAETRAIELLAEVTADVDARAVSSPPWRLVDVTGIFAPLPPVPYLVQHLDLCLGAPALVAGYGFSGKTMAVQSLALSVATGRPVWGAWSVARRGRVVHTDYEQGQRLTAERYQRLAYGMGVGPEQIEERLAIVPLPRVSLASAEGRKMLRELAEGAALVIVDSLRACAPELDENSSEIRAVLDTMTAVSEETGAVFVVVHHARKPTQDASGGAKASIRGSGAIFDACASVFVFASEKGGPVDVSHEKARTSGVTADDFALVISDVDGRAGLRVDVSGETKATRVEAAQASALAERVESVVRYVVEHPGCGSHDLRAALGGKTDAARAAIDAAIANGRIHDRGAGGDRSQRRYYVGAWTHEHRSQSLSPMASTPVVVVDPPKGGGPRSTLGEVVDPADRSTRGHVGPRSNGTAPHGGVGEVGA